MSDPNIHRHQVITVAINPRFDCDREKLQTTLRALVKEEPAMEIEKESDSGQTIISGVNDLHLEIICDRIVKQYKISIDVGVPRVVYLETVRQPAEGEGKYIRQTGGAGNYAHCKLRVEPNEYGRGYEFINGLADNAVPREYIKSIDESAQAALEGGILAGFRIVDVKVTLFDGSYHEIDSNEVAFKIAGSIAFKEAARKASPVLLEPVMAVEVTAPETHLGTIIGDLNSRRGRIESIERSADSLRLKAKVPLAEMLGYGRDIRSITGLAHHSMCLARYEAVLLPGESGGHTTGVTADKPNGPRTGSDFTTARFEPKPE